jgi:hypothetical protein
MAQMCADTLRSDHINRVYLIAFKKNEAGNAFWHKIGWEKRDDRVWRMYFTPGREGIIPRPTNAEFISGLAERYKQTQQRQA